MGDRGLRLLGSRGHGGLLTGLGGILVYGRADKTIAVGFLVTACATLAVACLIHPAACGYGTHTQLGLPPCTFQRLTHLPCPSCGLTTSFAHAIRLHFREAFLASPFGLLAFVGTLLMIPTSLALLWRRIPFRQMTESAQFCKVVYAASVLYILSWIFKVAQIRFAIPGH